MNFKERHDWLKAVAACMAGFDLRALTAASAALEDAAPGRWEISMGGGGLHMVGLRFFGKSMDTYEPWLTVAAKAFGVGTWRGAAAPTPGFPWLSATWDLKTGFWTSLRFYGEGGSAASRLKIGQSFAWDFASAGKTPIRRLLSPAPYKAGIFKEPVLDGALEDFDRLCPLSTFLSVELGWSLRLARPIRWPMFARCDVSAAFAPHSSQLALFLLDRHVTELSFDGEALWVHCAG